MRKWVEIAIFLLKPQPRVAPEPLYGKRYTGYTVTGPDLTE